jgi:integrase/recombinase XerC
MPESQISIISSFITYLLDERHYSPYTARCYGVDLSQYSKFLADELGITVDHTREQAFYDARCRALESNGPAVTESTEGETLTAVLLEAEAGTILRFLGYLGQQKYSAATMMRKIATLRSFHRWLHKCELIDTNPMVMIRTPPQVST